MKQDKALFGSAVLAALAASLCCVGPLLFVALGLGTFSAAAAFEAARPYLLGVAAVLLAFGFYRTYFKREKECASGEACATKPINKVSRLGLWIASVAVLAFAFSPYYAGKLAYKLQAAGATTETTANEQATTQTTFKVEGMTCGGCETTVRLALERMPGVRRAEVSYSKGEALVEYDPQATSADNLRKIINQIGYKVENVR
ncbi:MAG: mercuric transporter MerT family protein [Acidobacteriota bacterium]